MNKKRRPVHKCFSLVDEQLAPHNTVLDRRLQVGFGLRSVAAEMRLVVGTEKIDSKKRKPAKTVLATFCPFCGVNLENVESN